MSSALIAIITPVNSKREHLRLARRLAELEVEMQQRVADLEQRTTHSAADGTADFVAYGTTRRAAQVGLQIVNPFAAHRAWAAVRSFQPDVALVHLFAYHLSPAVLWPLRSVPTV